MDYLQLHSKRCFVGVEGSHVKLPSQHLEYESDTLSERSHDGYLPRTLHCVKVAG
jgi:hypothetical protein